MTFQVTSSQWLTVKRSLSSWSQLAMWFVSYALLALLLRYPLS